MDMRPKSVQHGCRDAQLSSVLDNGGGTPAALAVLYMEVARRLGIPMVSISYHTTLPSTHALLKCTWWPYQSNQMAVSVCYATRARKDVAAYV